MWATPSTLRSRWKVPGRSSPARRPGSSSGRPRPGRAPSMARDALGSINESPIVLADGDIVVGDASGKLHRLDSTGTPVWSTPVDLGAAVHAPMALTDGPIRFLVATVDGRLHALDDLGTVLWSGPLTGGAAARGGNIYTPPDGEYSGFSTAYFGGADGKLYAVVVEGGLDTAAPVAEGVARREEHEPGGRGVLTARPLIRAGALSSRLGDAPLSRGSADHSSHRARRSASLTAVVPSRHEDFPHPVARLASRPVPPGPSQRRSGFRRGSGRPPRPAAGRLSATCCAGGTSHPSNPLPGLRPGSDA